jgi:hypothetical protein
MKINPTVYKMPIFYKTEFDKLSEEPLTDKCIVLDLDQTLIATQDEIKSLIKLQILTNPYHLKLRKRIYHLEIGEIGEIGDGESFEFWGVLRPHIYIFLLFCFKYFKYVIVWSAGKKTYVEAIVDHIFKDFRHPHVLYTFDDIEYSEDGQIEKPIAKMFKDIPHMSLENTFCFDDNDLTFGKNEGSGLLCPPYEPKLSISSIEANDDTLLTLMDWLLLPEVSECVDVRTLNKQKIF